MGKKLKRAAIGAAVGVGEGLAGISSARSCPRAGGGGPHRAGGAASSGGETWGAAGLCLGTHCCSPARLAWPPRGWGAPTPAALAPHSDPSVLPGRLDPGHGWQGGAGVGLVGIPAGICMLGFTSSGIAAGSVAAKMMSAAAIANNGGVAAGSAVAVLQSIGAAGFSLGTKIGLTSVLGSLGAAAGVKTFQEEE